MFLKALENYHGFVKVPVRAIMDDLFFVPEAKFSPNLSN